MSQFLDPLRIEQIGWRKGRAVWETLSPLRYESNLLGVTIFIPAEAISDLASVPRLPLSWLVAGGRGNRAAVIHDLAYMFGFWWLIDGTRLDVPRPLVDAVFHESLLADPMSGAGLVIAWQMWAAVRVGGRGVWSERDARAPDLNPQWSREWGLVEA